MLAQPPHKNVLFNSSDALRDACADFAKSEGYVINQRDLDKKKSTAVEMCARNYFKARVGVVSGCAKVQQTTRTALSEITVWENANGGWRIITTIVADRNRGGGESESLRCLLVNNPELILRN